MSDRDPGSSPRQAKAGTSSLPPCTLVVFGAGGDLTKRLLVPSIYNLANDGLISDDFQVIGIDRVDQDDAGWRQHLTEFMQSAMQDKAAEAHASRFDEQRWQWLMQRLCYTKGDFADAALFTRLKKRIGEGNAIFYFAVADRFFAPLAEQLGKAGLLTEGEACFRRMVVEKPFGHDLATARDLNQRLLKVANEAQIYRIDHFLGKETVQSIMAVRFANGMFEPIWRREFVDCIQITAAETVGVERRGEFYEHAGALRDMVPNHLFQLLCMVAMEPPSSLSAEAVRDEKSKLMAALRPLGPDDVVRGQYEAGAIDGNAVQGYRQEPGVAPESTTETYVALRLAVDNWRWGGVPFFLRTGKRLAERRTEIAIHFQAAPHQLFQDAASERLARNVLTLKIDPEHAIETSFDAKEPGPAMRLGRVTTRMNYADFFPHRANVGYETLLYDCMMGDATLFQRADAIERAWTVVAPALEGFAAGAIPLETYEAGSRGPAGADRLTGSEHAWAPLRARSGG